MATEKEYIKEIRRYEYSGLKRLWKSHLEKAISEEFWDKGKLMEYAILRAFELEGKGEGVTYPFSVKDKDTNITLEQIDGAVHVEGMYALVECKDYTDTRIDVEPLAKMRNQLARRHGSTFGMFFSSTDYTIPAQILVRFMAPQLIILWTREDICHCMQNECFIPCMKEKYRMAVEQCEYEYAYRMEKADFEMYSKPLF